VANSQKVKKKKGGSLKELTKKVLQKEIGRGYNFPGTNHHCIERHALSIVRYGDTKKKEKKI